MSTAHQCVLTVTHLIGIDSCEQNADTACNEAITLAFSVYLAICQFNNLWRLEGAFLRRNMILGEHYASQLNSASFPSLTRR